MNTPKMLPVGMQNVVSNNRGFNKVVLTFPNKLHYLQNNEPTYYVSGLAT